MAILAEEEKITPRLIHETVKLNQQIIKEMLGETRMKKPREIKPVSDLDDLEQVYEAKDPLERLSAEASNNGSMKNLPPVDGADGDAAEVRPKQMVVATTPKGKRGLKSSDNKNDKASKMMISGREGFSKGDLRNRAGAGSQKMDKYSKSPDEYLKE